MKKFVKYGLVAGISFFAATEVAQKETNKDRLDYNHVLDLNTMKTKDKILQLLATTKTSNRIFEVLDKKNIINVGHELDFKAGILHLYAGSLSSVNEARKNIQAVKQESQIPPLVSVDLEGGAVNHFKISLEDLVRFNVPEEIIEMRKRELDFYNQNNSDKKYLEDMGRSPLPSQEWLGREYKSIRSNTASREHFLNVIKEYGSCLARICQHVGIDIVFGPNVDRVENIEGNNPMEKDDRCFGEDYKIISDLATAYISGFDNSSVKVCPKHFVGNGICDTDPHLKTSKILKDPNKGTSILPFRDVVNHRIENENNGKPNAFDFLMISNVANSFYSDGNVPTMFSKRALSALKKEKNNNGLGFNGLAITDDLTMNSSQNHIRDMDVYKQHKFDENTLAVWNAFRSGNDISLIKNSINDLDKIAEQIANIIDHQIDLDLDGEVDIDVEKINKACEKIFEIKSELGLLDKICIDGKDYYAINPSSYNLSNGNVLWDSFFSNQWPWLSKQKYYKEEGKKKEFLKDNFNMLYKAVKNFSLTCFRSFQNFESLVNEEKILVVDKSLKRVFVYDKKTNVLIKHFSVGIGKGTDRKKSQAPRRIVGDYKTPVGHYRVVQKRNNDWWKENKKTGLPGVYGGADGAIIAMTGQWHPEIAFHSTNGAADGEVSNGCVRLDDSELEYFLENIPLGTFVMITN